MSWKVATVTGVLFTVLIAVLIRISGEEPPMLVKLEGIGIAISFAMIAGMITGRTQKHRKGGTS